MQWRCVRSPDLDFGVLGQDVRDVPAELPDRAAGRERREPGDPHRVSSPMTRSQEMCELLQGGERRPTQALSQISIIGQLLERPRQAFDIARHKTVVTVAHQLHDASGIREGDDRLAGVKGLQRDVAIGVLTKRQVNHAARMRHQPDLFLLADPDAESPRHAARAGARG